MGGVIIYAVLLRFDIQKQLILLYKRRFVLSVYLAYLFFSVDIRHTPEYAELYKERKEKIERVFADAKEKHAMRYTPYRGLAAVTNWVKLKFVAMNLKKLAIHKEIDRKRMKVAPFSSHFSTRFKKFIYKYSKLGIRSHEFRVFLQSVAGRLPAIFFRDLNYYEMSDK